MKEHCQHRQQSGAEKIVVVEDTRNKIHRHDNIKSYLKDSGIMLIRSKLIVGDYAIANKQNVSIDTKKDMVELSQNIFADHKRFREECKLADDCGIHLVVLIEDDLVGGWDDLMNWISPQPNRSSLTPNGERCFKVMKAMEYTYHVRFEFCDKRQTGRRIVEILTEGRNE